MINEYQDNPSIVHQEEEEICDSQERDGKLKLEQEWLLLPEM
jgi:hypothetical protein